MIPGKKPATMSRRLITAIGLSHKEDSPSTAHLASIAQIGGAKMAVQLRTIEFHDGHSTIHYRGASNYSIPEGHPSATVTFDVIAPRGESIEMTVVVSQNVEDYNELVDVAYRKLANRLRQFEGIADKIDANLAPAEEQAG